MTSMLEALKPKSDQINADDLIGRTLTIRITEVGIKAGDQPISVHYEDDNGKPYKPCKSMGRMMVHVWGEDAKQYVGKSMTLYCDPKVTFGPMQMGGIRISHMSHLDAPRTVMLTVTKASRKPFTVKPLVIEVSPPADDKGAEDKDTKMATSIVTRINAAADLDALKNVTANPKVVEWRAFFTANRPELAKLVSDAVETSLALYTVSDEMPDGQEAA